MTTMNLEIAKARLDIFLASYNRALGEYSLTGETALLFHGAAETCAVIELQVPGFAWEIMTERYSGRVVNGLGGDVYVEFQVGPYDDSTSVRIRDEHQPSEMTSAGRLETLASISKGRRVPGVANDDAITSAPCLRRLA